MGSGAGMASLTFFEFLSLYGYSLAIYSELAIYVPVSIFCLIQVNWVQWMLVFAGAGLSGGVLFMTVWPAIRNQAAKSAAIVMCVLLALHLLLASGFMLYFFHHDSVDRPVQPTQAPGNYSETLAAVTAQKSLPIDERKKLEVVGTIDAPFVAEQKKDVIVTNEAEAGKDEDKAKDNGITKVQDKENISKIVKEEPSINGETNKGENSVSKDKVESVEKPKPSEDKSKPS